MATRKLDPDVEPDQVWRLEDQYVKVLSVHNGVARLQPVHDHGAALRGPRQGMTPIPGVRTHGARRQSVVPRPPANRKPHYRSTDAHRRALGIGESEAPVPN
jgi:hypothetical protein